jgi:hypothetical protein
VRILVAAALVLVAPALGRALDFQGNLGLRYDRVDNWPPGQAHTFTPALRLDASLDGAGYLSSPDVLQWSAGASYQRLSMTYLEQDSIDNAYGYRLHLGLFDAPSSVVSLAADASHTNVDHSVSTATGSATGTTTADTYGVQLGIQARNRPSLTVGALYADATNSGFGRTPTDETMKQVTAGFTNGPGPFSVSGNYEGRWSEGSLAPVNYERHTARVNGAVNLSEASRATMSAQYLLRTPEIVAPDSPRIEQVNASAGYRWGDQDSVLATRYIYGHSILTAPATPLRERVGQALSGTGEKVLSPTWRGSTTVELSLNQDRTDTAEDLSAGQSVSFAGRWNRLRAPDTDDWSAEGGPRVGLLEPSTGGVEIAYGVSGRGRWGRQRPAYRLGGEYGIDYGSNLSGVRGWTLVQRLSGEAERAVANDVRLRAALLLSALRQDLNVFGANASRDATLTGTVLWGRHSMQLEAGLSEGVSGSMEPIGGDGLFVPAKFQSRGRFASLGVSLGVASGLVVEGRARIAARSGPEVPKQQEASVGGAIRYSFGLFQLSAEERYVVGGFDNFDNRNNLFFVVLSRSLGGRF